jgi:hypothetical protein
MHENRETSETPAAARATGRREKATSQETRTHVSEESDSGVVPVNCSNKGGKPSAESREGRALTKENTKQPHTRSTQSEGNVSQGLSGVRKAAKERKKEKFTSLLHPYPQVRFDATHIQGKSRVR